MVGKIEFPDGITWQQRYVTGGDFLGSGYESLSANKLYFYTSNSVIYINWSTSNVIDMSSMFEGSSCGRVFNLDTSSATNLSKLFYGTSLKFVPQLNTSNVTNMSYMFSGCQLLTTIPQLDTSSVTNMYQMFYYCSKLTTIPQLDVSSVTDVSKMFSGCSNLVELPDFNCVNLKTFGGASYNTWLYNSSNIQKIGVIDCDSVTNIGYIFGDSNRNYLTDFGGCRNLGKASSVSNTNSSYFMNYAPNLNYQSVLNVLNGLYDRASAGLSVLTLKLHANHLAMLSENDIAIATNKGWTIV